MRTQAVSGWLLVMLCLLALPAFAQSTREVRKLVEASLLVTGSVDIDRDGRVSAHAIDSADKLPPAVVDLVQRVVPEFRFEPVLVDGTVVQARASMTLRIIAKPVDDGGMTIRIGGAHFGEVDLESTDAVRSSGNLKPPRYPQDAMRAGAHGTMYVVVQIGRDGSVQDALVEQVNLRVIAPQAEMDRFRRQFGNVALAAARKWVFLPPTTGPLVDEPNWSVRVPVDFSLYDSLQSVVEAPYGTWQGYVPGPRQRAPWISQDDAQGSADAIADGGIYSTRTRFRLLTPLEG